MESLSVMLTVLLKKFWFQPGNPRIYNSLGILDSKKHSEGYEFFIGDKKINAEFKTIGTFENLIFIEAS